MMRIRLTLASKLFAAVAILTVASQCHAATPPDETAQAMMSAAEQQAAAAHKAVLVDFSASWCGNCRLFDRFWDDPTMHPILDKAFIRLTLDAGERPTDTRHHNTPGAEKIEASLGGANAGYPFIAIADTNGKLIVSTIRDKHLGMGDGNIGYPDAPDEVRWFVHMLQVSAPQLSPKDLDTIHAWLTAHSTVSH